MIIGKIQITERWGAFMLPVFLAMMETPQEESLFESIYFGYRKQMYCVAKKVLNNDDLVEDALQNAFLGIAQQITRFQGFTPDEIRAYVLTVAKNAAIQLYSKNRKERNQFISIEEIIQQPSTKDTAREIIVKDKVRGVLAVINTLPSTYRDILLLRYTYNMNSEEIAIVLGKSRGAVRQHMTRARKALRDACKKEGIILED